MSSAMAHVSLPPPPRAALRVAALSMSMAGAVSLVPLAIGTLVAAWHADLASLPFFLLFLLLPANLVGVGTLLTRRRPENAIGWLLLGSGVLAGITFSAGEYERAAITAGATDAVLLVPVAWIAASWFVPAVGALVVLLPLLYPTGHLLGRRWRVVAAAAVYGIVAGALGPALMPGPMGDPRGPLNPLVLSQPLLGWIATANALSNVMGPPVFVLALVSLVIRFRRSRGVERQQIKWFLFVASIVTVAFAISLAPVGPVSDAAWALGLLAMAFLPAAIGVAILRYRLYEIDKIVSRAVAYAIVTIILGATFAMGVIMIQEALASLTQASTLAVAASTLVVASAFRPLLRRIQAFVDRRFDRSHVNAERLLMRFAADLRDVTDVTAINTMVATTTRTGWAPTAIGLWIREHRGPENEPATNRDARTQGGEAPRAHHAPYAR